MSPVISRVGIFFLPKQRSRRRSFFLFLLWMCRKAASAMPFPACSAVSATACILLREMLTAWSAASLFIQSRPFRKAVYMLMLHFRNSCMFFLFRAGWVQMLTLLLFVVYIGVVFFIREETEIGKIQPGNGGTEFIGFF